MSPIAALSEILPGADREDEIDRMDTPSALVLSAGMLCIIIEGIS